MSFRDYLCCDKCGKKILYDENKSLSEYIQNYFDGKNIICPDCVDEINQIIKTKSSQIDQMKVIMEAAASVAGKNWLCVQIALSEYLSDGEGDHLDWLLSEYLKMKEQDKTVDG